MEVMHRDDRTGYKAGALSIALARTTEEFIVVFDSDFLPRPDFLDRAAAYITAHPRLGWYQFKWKVHKRVLQLDNKVSLHRNGRTLSDRAASQKQRRPLS